MSGASRRGHDRERKVKAYAESLGWVAQRAAGSLGLDVIAIKAGQPVLFIEVKSTSKGPYEGFGPADRKKLKALAKKAGALAYLCWWPPNGPRKWIPAKEWPCEKRK